IRVLFRSDLLTDRSHRQPPRPELADLRIAHRVAPAPPHLPRHERAPAPARARPGLPVGRPELAPAHFAHDRRHTTGQRSGHSLSVPLRSKPGAAADHPRLTRPRTLAGMLTPELPPPLTVRPGHDLAHLIGALLPQALARQPPRERQTVGELVLAHGHLVRAGDVPTQGYP